MSVVDEWLVVWDDYPTGREIAFVRFGAFSAIGREEAYREAFEVLRETFPDGTLVRSDQKPKGGQEFTIAAEDAY